MTKAIRDDKQVKEYQVSADTPRPTTVDTHVTVAGKRLRVADSAEVQAVSKDKIQKYSKALANLKNR